MEPNDDRRFRNSIKRLDKKLSQFSREIELLYLITENKDLSGYDLESDLASARFQLESILSKIADKNNHILLDILKQKQAT